MRIHNIDNGSSEQINAAILWQYCTAHNLRGIMNMFDGIFKSTTEDFWNSIAEDVVNIDTADDFGLSIWGFILHVPRPNAIIDETSWTCSADFYRKLLKAKYILYKSGMSKVDIQIYADSVFGTGAVSVVDNLDMSMDYENIGIPEGSEEEIAFNSAKSIIFEFPAAVMTNERVPETVLGFDGQEESPQIEGISIGNLGDDAAENEDSATFANIFTLTE